MQFPHFEKSVETKILNRGFDYYEQDLVEDIEALGSGEFSAIVQGSDEYEVWVKIDTNEVVEHSCTCPYDWGDVCKHVVAVLYYIRDAEMHTEEYINTTEDQLNVILAELSEAEMRTFILHYAKRYRDFREMLFENFG
jgi:uncharacterized Zn finger protein